jgi:hypothetical protein
MYSVKLLCALVQPLSQHVYMLIIIPTYSLTPLTDETKVCVAACAF